MSVLAELRLYVANYVVAYIPSHVIRLAFYRKVMKFDIEKGSSIFMGCYFDCAENLVVGEDSTINESCSLDTRGGIYIGNNVTIASDVAIITAAHNVHAPEFAGQVASVSISDYVFIGRRATILMGCKLGVGACFGAGSVLTKSIRIMRFGREILREKWRKKGDRVQLQRTVSEAVALTSAILLVLKD